MTTVRAVFTAVPVPGAAAPFDRIHVKVHYPAAPTGSDEERLSGAIPPSAEAQPFPVVLLLNGINVGPEAYGWLAQRLAADGAAVVTYSWVGELFPGQYGLTPGVDLDAVRPDTYGSRPSGSAIAPLLAALASDDGLGPLAGALDLDRVALVGHSAGGTVVLQNSDASFVPGLRAGVSYAGHTAAATVLGWDAGTVLPCPGDAPLLLLGGTEDGVIRRSADRYGPDGHARDPLTRTFDEGVATGREAHLAVVAGANHFAIGHPEDPTVARGFLDGAPTADPEATRAYLGDLVAAFLDLHLHDRRDAAARLRDLLGSPALAVSRSTPTSTPTTPHPAPAGADDPRGGTP